MSCGSDLTWKIFSELCEDAGTNSRRGWGQRRRREREGKGKGRGRGREKRKNRKEGKAGEGRVPEQPSEAYHDG